MIAIKMVIAYAFVVMIGGAMQSIDTIPYENQIIDGNEFTRDMIAGVAHKTSLSDAQSGIPMYGRYSGSINIQKSTDVINSAVSADSFIAKSENKIREIGWMPALHFSANASELEQVSYEFPVEKFEDSGVIASWNINQAESLNTQKQPIGSAHSGDYSFVFFRSVGDTYYINESVSMSQFNKILVPSGVNFVDFSYATSYDGAMVLVGKTYYTNGTAGVGVDLYYFDGNSVVKMADGISATSFRRYGAYLVMGQTVYDFDNNEIISLESARKIFNFSKMYNSSLLGRFSFWNNYTNKDIGSHLKAFPKSSPSDIAIEFRYSGSRPLISSISYTNTTESDIGVKNGTFHYWKDPYTLIDSGVQHGLVPSGNNNVARSHNYLYATVQRISGGKIYYDLHAYELRNRKVYGDKKYYEKGRQWQQ